jgi:hypothetical protein
MSDSIKYSTGLNAVAVDSVGNLVTDSAGNLVIPIEALKIYALSDAPTVTVGEVVHQSTTTTLKFPDKTVSFTVRNGDDKITKAEGICEGRSGITLNMRYLQQRYGDSVTFGVAVAESVKRKYQKSTAENGSVQYCVEYQPSSHVSSIVWNGESIYGDSTKRCVGESVHVGKVTIDFQSATATLDTSSVPTDITDECGECRNEPPTITITIVCDYAYCEPDLGATRYIANSLAYLWGSAVNEVVVEYGETEDEAIAKAATKYVESEKKQYITADNPSWATGKRFWRDEDKDEPGSYDVHAVPWLRTCTRNAVNNNGTPWGEELWVEQTRESGNGKTGRVFNRASWYRYPTLTEAMEYDIDRATVVAENLEYEYHDTSRYTELEWYEQKLPGLLSLYHLTNGKVITDVPCKCIGPRDFGDSLGVWYKHESQPLTNYPTVHTVWAAPGSRGDYGRVFVDHEPNLTWDENEGIYKEEGVFIDVWSPLTEWIKYNDKMWLLAGILGFLFTIKSYHAWTLSPCDDSENRIIYTDYSVKPEDINTDTTVYLPYTYEGDENIYWYPEGLVSSTGEGIYSVTSEYGSKYYWKEDLNIVTDEEFE